MSIVADIIYSLRDAELLFGTSLVIIFCCTTILHYKSLVKGSRTIRRAIFATVISGLSIGNFWLLFDPPVIEQKLDQVTILTVGTSDKIIADKLQRASTSKPVFLDGISTDFQSEHIKIFSKQAIRALPEGASVNIHGDGIAAYKINKFPKQHITFSASEKLAGLSEIQWTKRLQLGNQLIVSGQVTNPGIDKFIIELIDPTGQITAEVKTEQTGFSLTTWPKANGLYHYQILLKDEQNKVIYQELIPVEIVATGATKILIIADAPSFEINRLQRFLENQGAPLVSRIKISKNKFKTHFSEIEEFSFSEKLPLEMFDLLIIDERSLKQLTESSRQQLETTIKSFGLGVLVLLSEQTLQQTSTSNKILDQWFLLSPQGKTIEQTKVKLPEYSTGEDDDILLSAISRHFIAVKDHNILLRDNLGNTLAIATKSGAGKIGATRILDSHKLAASAEQLQLKGYWRTLIEGLSKADILSSKVSLQQHLPVVNDELIICKTGNTNSEIIIANDESSRIHLQSSHTSDNQLCGRFWPQTTGWHQIVTDDLNQSFFVFDRNQWRSARQAILHGKNRDMVNASASPVKVTFLTPLPLEWLVISLFILLGICWAEQKF